jgi:uncharacterized protein (TIGR02271 family)
MTRDEIQSLIGDEVYSSDGEKIGKVTDLFFDTTSPDQCWIGVIGGFLGLKHRTVPLDGAELRSDDQVWLAYTKDQIDNSPELYGDSLDDNGVDTLGSHYGLDWDSFHSPQREDFSSALTRHEEELSVGKEQVNAGSVRLRKWVETQPVTETVSLERETADVRVEPINEPVSHADFSDDEVSVELTAEQAVVDKQTIAKERVSLETGSEVEQQQVSDTLRKEHVEVEESGDIDRTDGRTF